MIRRGPNKRRDKIPGNCSVIVTNVNEDVTEEDVVDFFIDKCGRVEGIKRIDNDYQVKLFDDISLEDAVRCSGELFRGRRLNVDYCYDNSSPLGHPFRPALDRKGQNCHTLFVGNIPEAAAEDDLRYFFTKQLPDCPVVSATLRRGGFKGMYFAHVKFASSEACEKASTLAGNFLRGSRLRLDWAQDKGVVSEKPTDELRGRTTRIFIGNLPDNIQEEDVEKLFSKYGPVTSLRLHRDRNGVKSFGYLTFATETAADNSVADSNNIAIRGSVIRVDFARQDRPPGQARSPPASNAEPRKRPRSVSPERQTPVSFEVPLGYGPQPDWEQLYAR